MADARKRGLKYGGCEGVSISQPPRLQGRMLTPWHASSCISNDSLSPPQPTRPGVIEIKSFSAPFALCGWTLADCPENELQIYYRTQRKKDGVTGTGSGRWAGSCPGSPFSSPRPVSSRESNAIYFARRREGQRITHDALRIESIVPRLSIGDTK